MLRATYPAKIRQARSGGPTFAAASPYWAAEPGGGDLARRLSGYVVLAHDPAVPSAAKDYWDHSAAFYRSAAESTRALAARDHTALAAYRRLAADPAATAAERHLQARLAELLLADPDPELGATAHQAADEADDNVYIGYFRGADYQPAAPPAGLDRLREITRGLLLRDVPGGCLWIRPEIFHRIGGLDERYRGWGGEDEDMLIRTAAAGPTTQYDDVLLHLAHPRPAMRREDGTPLNAHVPIGTWTGGSGYGDLAGPAGAQPAGAGRTAARPA